MGSFVACRPPSAIRTRVDRPCSCARMRQGTSLSEVVARLSIQLEANAAMLGGSVKASPLLGQAVSRCRLRRTSSARFGDLTKSPFDWSATSPSFRLAHCWSFDAGYLRRTHGRVLERRWEAASAIAGMMAHCGPQTSRNRPKHHSLHARGRGVLRRSSSASWETHRRQSVAARPGLCRSRPKQLAMAVGHARRWKNRRG